MQGDPVAHRGLGHRIRHAPGLLDRIPVVLEQAHEVRRIVRRQQPEAQTLGDDLGDGSSPRARPRRSTAGRRGAAPDAASSLSGHRSARRESGTPTGLEVQVVLREKSFDAMFLACSTQVWMLAVTFEGGSCLRGAGRLNYRPNRPKGKRRAPGTLAPSPRPERATRRAPRQCVMRCRTRPSARRVRLAMQRSFDTWRD